VNDGYASIASSLLWLQNLGIKELDEVYLARLIFQGTALPFCAPLQLFIMKPEAWRSLGLVARLACIEIAVDSRMAVDADCFELVSVFPALRENNRNSFEMVRLQRMASLVTNPMEIDQIPQWSSLCCGPGPMIWLTRSIHAQLSFKIGNCSQQSFP
jgi:hypothetical protein